MITIPPEHRERVIALVVCVLVGVGAFSAGRFSAPLKVERVEVKVKGETVIERVEVKGETVYVKGETRVVYRDRVITKDGTITEHEVERSVSKEDGKVSLATNADRSATLTERVESKQSTTNRPDWRVSLLVGASYQAPLLPVYGPLALGVMGERRIVGGLFVGVWTLPQFGAVGGSLSFEF